MLFKEIIIGEFIQQKVNEMKIDMDRICNFLDCNECEIKKMYQSESLPTNVLLQWCKLLEYDFFRLYSQHLILYAPPAKQSGLVVNKNSDRITFRKNLYTEDMIQFILEMIRTEKKTKRQVIEEYRIPKTTLHKWLQKFRDA
ncbi:transposase [Chryseobacterium indologenes]|nr:transposase [Chryseobacterium indologenes]ASE61851.1 transposase [Chryseobacterium indologenes]ATN05789.1 transposase [Chryseobacterium indologenes]AYY85453.1 transposase [Chryseobacterium indologenes]QIX82349.1 transposase [Chryseobacterium indologenes]UDQ51984.1 transposase [Chryseobacterium indologenes]